MSSPIRVRFAPSPTGYLHIGGARTALFNWLFARHHHGTFILRIEDTDEVRSTPESVDAILESLDWLGLHWDEGPVLNAVPAANSAAGTGRAENDLRPDWKETGAFGPYFQMRRLESYRKYVRQLLDEGKAYPCYCTIEELDAMRRRAQLEKRPPRYDGRCRHLTAEQKRSAEAAGRKASIRLRMPDDGATVVTDLAHGEVRFENKLLQDFVIQKAAGGPTYNFACVVDDHLMEISHVIRGEEHLSNTPSQLQLYRALGWNPPQFAHLSMILGPDGAKLSKRHGATSVMEYAAQGYLPETMRNYLALLGWSTPDSQQLFETEDLASKFDLKGCQKNPATFDPQKFLWMNGVYVRKMSPRRLIAAAAPFLERAGLARAPGEKLAAVVMLELEKVKLLADVPRLVDFFFKDAVYEPKAVDKTLKAQGADKILEDMAAWLKETAPFDEKTVEARVREFCAKNNLKTGQVFHPLRVAVSGRTEGPTLFGMLALLGKDEVVRRLSAARRLLSAV